MRTRLWFTRTAALTTVIALGLAIGAVAATASKQTYVCQYGAQVVHTLYGDGPSVGQEAPDAAAQETVDAARSSQEATVDSPLVERVSVSESEDEGFRAVYMVRDDADGPVQGVLKVRETSFGRYVTDEKIMCRDEAGDLLRPDLREVWTGEVESDPATQTPPIKEDQ